MIPVQWQIYGTMAVAVLSVMLAVWALMAASRLKRRYLRFLGTGKPDNVDAWLAAMKDQVGEMTAALADQERRLSSADARLLSTLRKVGLVRFNPFDNTGSDLSFSLALLTETGDGLVLTSLWGREEVRLYAKPVKASQSRYPLSKEELRAIDMALNARDPAAVSAHPPRSTS
ncbi:MAG: DUF4446 family protein [Thermaerobacter sp.]|nr:DUF4446 family protein [Thermaerobacter sp.]